MIGITCHLDKSALNFIVRKSYFFDNNTSVVIPAIAHYHVRFSRQIFMTEFPRKRELLQAKTFSTSLSNVTLSLRRNPLVHY